MLNYIDFHQQKSLTEIANVVKHELDNIGYVVIQNFANQIKSLDQKKEIYLNICKEVGLPIGHDNEGNIFWDIKSNPKSASFIKTYSEHSHEAELHTDSQYSEYPEDYFGLLTIKKALCGGGLSFLLSLKDILKEFREAPENQKHEKILRTTAFPFIVPNVFKKNDSIEREYNFGPILRENEIRFRVDTFEKALKENPTFCSSEQINAFRALKSCILNSPSIRKFYLEDDDLVFINNKTMLHGRTSFTDTERHLIRIRMNKL